MKLNFWCKINAVKIKSSLKVVAKYFKIKIMLQQKWQNFCFVFFATKNCLMEKIKAVLGLTRDEMGFAVCLVAVLSFRRRRNLLYYSHYVISPVGRNDKRCLT